MLIFLSGTDAFSSSQKVLEIKNKFLAGDPTGSGLSAFDFESKDRKGKLLDVFGMANLLSPKRLVIVKNLIAAGSELEREEILAYLKKDKSLGQDSDLVVIFWEGNQPKKNSALFKFLEAKERVIKKQNFEKMSGSKLGQWIVKRIKELDAQADIARSALEKLAAYVGEDNFLLDKEIQKLVNFAGGKMIQDADVELLVKANVDSNIFATIDALGGNNKKEALRLLHQHLVNGDDPFYILSMFIYQFRNLVKIADLQENQKAGEYEIAKIAKLHPFVVKKSLSQIRNFSWEKLQKIYQKLTDLDNRVKTGKIEIKLALDKFIIEL
ncbi:MAG: DNA polymerase III subunit delta [Parcubacteria group bacterium]|jgi:DNA polymerase-3 subunit delta